MKCPVIISMEKRKDALIMRPFYFIRGSCKKMNDGNDRLQH